MKNKVKITVGGTEYTVVTQEDADYTKKLAEEVNESINDMCINGRISITAAAILTAVNLCDRLKKYEKEADSLGEQIEGYLHAASDQLTKYNELKKKLEPVPASESKGVNEPDAEKMKLMEELAEELRKANKTVNVTYF